VEYAKDVLYGTDEARRREVLQIMHFVFSKALRLLHPLMPFLTEELWHGMGYGGEADTIMRAEWPTAKDATLRGLAEPHVAYVNRKHELIGMRSDYEIAPGQKVDMALKPSGDVGALRMDERAIGLMLKAETLTIDPAFVPSKAMPSTITPLGTLYMSLGSNVDVGAEIAKFKAQIEQADGQLRSIDGKLSNEGFLRKAKPEIIEAERERRRQLTEKRDKLDKLIAGLSAANE
jgi:valyl-tRNA synthetase